MFLSNIRRAQTLAAMPQLIAGSTHLSRTLDCLALAQLHESEKSPLIAGLKDRRLNRKNPEFDQAVLDRQQEIRARYEANILQKMEDAEMAPFTDHSLEALDNLLGGGDQRLLDGLQAILQAIAVEVWTSFEVLVEEIWDAATQLKPSFGHGIPLRKNRKSPITGKDGKTGFRTLDSIRFTYEWAFAGEPAIMAILHDQRLLALASIRNLVVHKNGFVDGEFEKRQVALAGVPSFAPFVAVPKDQRITFTGASVRDLKNPVIDLGIDLVSEVDFWLGATP